MNALPPRRLPPTFRALGDASAQILADATTTRAMALVLVASDCDLGDESACIMTLSGSTPGGLHAAKEIGVHLDAAIELARVLKADRDIEQGRVG